jgi:hypothetical protein
MVPHAGLQELNLFPPYIILSPNGQNRPAAGSFEKKLHGNGLCSLQLVERENPRLNILSRNGCGVHAKIHRMKKRRSNYLLLDGGYGRFKGWNSISPLAILRTPIYDQAPLHLHLKSRIKLL